MKTNNITDVTKIIIFAGTVIIVCVLCALGFKMANEGKAAVNSGTSQYNDMAADYQDVDKLIYDGATVLGSEVTNLISKTVEKKEYLAISVKTLNNTTGTYYNAHFTASTKAVITTSATGTPFLLAVPVSKSSANYINPTAQYIGKVYKDANNIIVCVEFIQQ